MNVLYNNVSLYYPAFASFIILFGAWLYFFWSSLIVFFKIKPYPQIFIFNCFVILITLYFLYRERVALQRYAVTSSQLGLLCLFVLLFVWIIGGVNHLTEIQQTTALLILPSLVLISFGPYIIRGLVFPILFFLFIILFFENFFNTRLYIWIFAVIVVFSYVFYKKFFALRFNAHFYNEDPNKIIITRNARWLIPSLIALSMIVMSPWLSNNIREFYPLDKKKITLIVPIGIEGWIGPQLSRNSDWLPEFPKSSASISVRYTKRFSPFYVDLFSAYYQSNRTVEDLLDKKNKLYDPMVWNATAEQAHTVTLSNAYTIAVNEILLENASGNRLVWFWYYILGIPTVDLNFIDILDKVRVISKFADGSGLIAISTPVQSDVEQARLELSSFLKTMYPSLEILQRPEKIQSWGQK